MRGGLAAPPAAASLPAISDGSGVAAAISQLPLSHLATTDEPSPDQLRECHLVLEGDRLERRVELFVERDRGDGEGP